MEYYDLVVIGGGAAGFFAAITAAGFNPNIKIIILEKSPKVLSKVKVSGGGRCNVTHDCLENYKLIKHYPRGERFLKTAFKAFSVKDTVEWFHNRGVDLKIEEDGRMFPTTDNSQTIITCFLNEINRLKIGLKTSTTISKVNLNSDRQFIINTLTDNLISAERLIIACGGNPKTEGYQWIVDLGHDIVPPVPSLFTFNIPASDLKDLSGIAVPDAMIKIEGAKLEARGPLLITHWGLSGPAVLKLSAWGARELNNLNYSFNIQIRWIAAHSEVNVVASLNELKLTHSKKKIYGHSVYGLPLRLWQKLLQRSDIREEWKWADLPKKHMNVLMENLVRTKYQISGKTTFKEEFVTCGGVNTEGVDPSTMKSKCIEGLYFAGEVLDVDGITGGFNFQNAWTTGFIAGKEAAKAF